MISVESMLGIVCTEALESSETNNERGDLELPTVNYALELVENEDGTLEWVE